MFVPGSFSFCDVCVSTDFATSVVCVSSGASTASVTTGLIFSVFLTSISGSRPLLPV